jgi:hypothetical protein
MKTHFAPLWISLLGWLSVNAQEAPYSAIEQGPNHRVLARVTAHTNLAGRVQLRTNRYTEICTGLNFERDGKYFPSRPEFRLTPDGFAIADQAQHKLIIAPNANTPQGLVDYLAADGQRLRASVIGLNLYSPVTGHSVQVGAVKDCVGVQSSPNEVLFEDAFEGLKASLRFRNEIGIFHQEILLLEGLRPAQLAKLGFGPDDRPQIEVWTEMWTDREPGVQAFTVKSEQKQELRARMVEPDAVEEFLDFGAAKMIQGTAFADWDPQSQAVTVCKRWLRSEENRRFLLEACDLAALEPMLSKLPAAGFAQVSNRPSKKGLLAGRTIPVRQAAAKSGPPFLIARADPARQRPLQVTLDYQILSSTESNLVFAGHQTYLVSGMTYAFDKTVIEGGTVIKFATNANTGLTVMYNGSVECATGPYSMAVLTSAFNDTVGDTIAGSTGVPVRTAKALQFPNWCSGAQLQYLRFTHLGTGVSAVWNATVSHSQFIDCDSGVDFGSSLNLYNVLFADCGTNAFNNPSSCAPYCPAPAVSVQHITADNCGVFARFGSWSSTPSLSLLNCVLSGVSQVLVGTANVSSNATSAYSSGAGVYTSVVAGDYYLCDGSTNRNSGVTEGLNASLLAELKQQTTYAPASSSNTLTTLDTTLSPLAARDADQPDRGYHYPPIDYLVAVMQVTNATLTIGPGTVIGLLNQTGIWLNDAASLQSVGTPNQPVRFVHYALAQEQSRKIGGSQFIPINCWRQNGISAPASLRFSEFLQPAGLANSYQLYLDGDSWSYSELSIRDCVFRGGTMVTYGLNGNWEFQNNCVINSDSYLVDYGSFPYGFSFRNNLWKGGSFGLEKWASSNSWTVTDNVFDRCSVDVYYDSLLTHSHNAYIATSGAARIEPTNAYDVVLTNLTYLKGHLGPWYQPTNSPLRDLGSRSASAAGLYHHTTTTNQVKEAGTLLDIGFHYIATDAAGIPLDSDADGVPDYWEDRNGDGLVNNGETDSASASDPGLRVLITRPRHHAPVP